MELTVSDISARYESLCKRYAEVTERKIRAILALAEAKKKVLRMDRQLDAITANCNIQVRSDVAADPSKKYTEDRVKQEVAIHPSVMRARSDLEVAQTEKDDYQAHIDGCRAELAALDVEREWLMAVSAAVRDENRAILFNR